MPTPEVIKFPTREARKLLRRLRLRHAGIQEEINLSKLLIGRSDRASSPMAVHPDPLDEASIVYSFGVGRDIGWDIEMIERFGVTVHGFDPSPECIRWIESTDLPDRFVFHPIGIGAADGALRLYPPRRNGTVNYSVVNRARAAEEDAVDVPVRTLASIAAMLGHDRVDLVKMDVEGAEYALMPSVLDAGIPVTQITLEVHHNFPSLCFDDTKQLVRLLRDRGYRLFDVSQRGRELSFILR